MMHRNGTYLHAIPATPIADSNIWRVVVQQREHMQDDRIDVTDPPAREKLIRDWCEKTGIEFAHGLWIYGAIDDEVGDWLKTTDEVKELKRLVDALAARCETMEQEWKGMNEKYEGMKTWVLTKLKGNGNGN